MPSSRITGRTRDWSGRYNHPWIFARAFLRDAFGLLTAHGYRIGKLTPKGVEFYPGWNAELETFVEGNYVACDPVTADCLPACRAAAEDQVIQETCCRGG